MKRLTILLLLLPIWGWSINKQKVDLLVCGKLIYTVDAHFSTASAVAIKSGKIVAVGEKALLLSQYDAEHVIDEPNKYIYPGFIDAHCHFSGYALDGYKCNLVGTASYKDVLDKLIAYEQTNTLPWIYGRGWDQNDWAIKEYPTKDELDKLFPKKPVILKRIDGHAILCNQYALDKAGITMGTSIKGGIIEKKNGRLTGILIDNATESVEKLITSLPENTSITYLKNAEKECFSYGLTAVVDCGITTDAIELLKKLYANKVLSIDNTVLLSNDKPTLDRYIKWGPSKAGRLKISGIKVYADGALGSRGACLLNDYSDMPGHRGMLLTPIAQVDSLANMALKYKWQLCTHAIGDSANRTMLKLYAAKLKKKNDKRWRIEHAQVVNPSDHHYFGDYSIIPSVQPTHAISDMPWAETRLGSSRINGAYSYKELEEQNNWIALGTDFPVEGIDPLATFYTAVARKDKDGNPSNGFLYQNALSRIEALKGITTWAAKSVFNDQSTGSIEIGKNADIVILNQDIMTINEEKLLNTKVLYTIVNGIVVYKK